MKTERREQGLCGNHAVQQNLIFHESCMCLYVMQEDVVVINGAQLPGTREVCSLREKGMTAEEVQREKKWKE